jgi:hypothetical protein
MELEDLPAAVRQSLRDRMQEANLESAIRMPAETEAMFAARMHSSQLFSGLVSGFVRDGERVHCGVAVAREPASLGVDVTLEVARGSELAGTLRVLLGQKSAFSPAAQGDDLFSAGVALPLHALVKRSVLTLFPVLRERIRQRHQASIKNNTKLSDQLSRSWRGANRIIDMAEEKIGVGLVDLALRVREEPPGSYALYAALALPDAQELETAVRENLAIHKELGFIQSIGEGGVAASGVRLVSVSPEWMAGRDTDLFGQAPLLHLGFSKTAVFLGYGKFDSSVMAKAVEAFVSPREPSSVTAFLRADCSGLARIASEVGMEHPFLEVLAGGLEGSGNRLALELLPYGDGVRLHTELREGLFRFVARSVVENFVTELGR